MQQWLAIAITLSYFQNVLGSCPYSSYGSTWVFVADENCVSFPMCAVNGDCTTNYFAKTRSDIAFSNIFAVGNMKNYTSNKLMILDSAKTTLKDMVLPPAVTSLTFQNITALDLLSVKASSWQYVAALSIVACKNAVTSSTISWPSKLTSFSIQGSDFNDLSYLPSNLTQLLLYNNTLQSVTNQDWRGLNFLNLGANPLITLANVQLSASLTFFFCKYTSLTNITIDASTAAALNSLDAWNENNNNLVGFAIDSNILTDSTKCTAIGGVIQQLFKGKTTYTVTACVLGSSSATTTAPVSTIATKNLTLVPTQATAINSTESNSSSNTGLIVGIIVGAIGIIGIGIVIFVFIRREKRLTKQSTEEVPYQSYNEPNPQPKVAQNRGYQQHQPESNTGHTQGTGRSVGTGNSQGSRGRLSVHLDNNIAELDLTYLFQHRLVLADLIVTSNKPLATGAFGEVWLGSYGAQQVAIKRLKSRQPRQVQKFIDEIILMSQLDSDYIVKFVGASWTRPIEIECVVEYMDLGDLRSYLVNQSPQQFTWEQKYQSIVSIVRGLVYLHTYKPQIIHRDLKSRNVLLDSVKGTKLTDFGTSRVAEEDDLMTNGIGTYQWMAPEVIAGTNYSSPADIYSFGIILSEFCTHQVPYAGHRNPLTGNLLSQLQILSEVREGRLHPSFDGEDVPSWVKDVAMRCLQLNEYDRPTSLELSAIFNRIKP